MSSEVNYSSEAVAPAIAQTGSLKARAFRADVYLSTRQLLLAVFFALIFTAAARPITDPDFWWHLKTGQFIVQTKSIPHTDLFSNFQVGKEWVTHEWLAEAFMYTSYRSVGYSGLIVIFAVLITAAFVISYWSFRNRVGHTFVVGFALLVGAFSTLPIWGVRPQIFSLLFASVFLALLDEYARKGANRKLWWLVPLTICWVNLHAGFAIGLVLLLLTIAGLATDALLTPGKSISSALRCIRVPAFIFLTCLAAAAINPSGARIYFYPFETLNSQAMMQYISEWWSPDFHEPMFQPLALLMLSTFAVLALSPKRVSFRELLLLAATCLATLRSARNVPFFALVAIPLLAEHLWIWLSNYEWADSLAKTDKRQAGNSAVVIVLNIVIFVLLPAAVALARVTHSAQSQPSVTSQEFPVAAANFVSSRRLPQPIYNEYGWGGYLIWRLYPDYRVYIDGRADVYGDSFLKEFLMVHDGEPNWREPLQRYGIRTVMIKPNVPLASLLRTDIAWEKVFEDPQAVIFTKRSN